VVKDQYGNPVSGAPVDLSLTNADDGSDLTSEKETVTDADGVATFRYTPSGSGVNATVAATIDDNSSAAERVLYRNRPIFGPGGVANGGNSDINEADQGGIRLNGGSASGKDTVQLQLNNTGNDDVTITRSRINFLANSSDGGPKYDEGAVLITGTDSPGTMKFGGPFVTYAEGSRPTLPSGDTTPVEIEFKPTGNGAPETSSIVFFVLTVEYSSGETDTYFVAP
jgi:hypothetical protein